MIVTENKNNTWLMRLLSCSYCQELQVLASTKLNHMNQDLLLFRFHYVPFYISFSSYRELSKINLLNDFMKVNWNIEMKFLRIHQPFPHTNVFIRLNVCQVSVWVSNCTLWWVKYNCNSNQLRIFLDSLKSLFGRYCRICLNLKDDGPHTLFK